MQDFSFHTWGKIHFATLDTGERVQIVVIEPALLLSTLDTPERWDGGVADDCLSGNARVCKKTSVVGN